jgi:hypothetical protein
VEENFLRKYVMKKGDGSDELINITFKCNFEHGFIKDVASKIEFELDEYIIGIGQ